MAASTYKIAAEITAIQDLADEPTESTAALKAKFDEGAESVRVQHNLLCDYTDAALATKVELAAAVFAGISDDSITNAKMAADVKIGSLAALTTTDKDSIIDAINEIDAAINGLEATKGVLYYGKYSQMSGGDAKAGAAQSGAIAFTSEDKDDFSAINLVASTSKIVIPAGVTLAKFYWNGYLTTTGYAADITASIYIRKNGVNLHRLLVIDNGSGSATCEVGGTYYSMPIACEATDYFEVYALLETNGTDSSLAAGSVFGMEVLG